MLSRGEGLRAFSLSFVLIVPIVLGQFFGGFILPIPEPEPTQPSTFTCQGHTYAVGPGEAILNGGFEQDLTSWYTAQGGGGANSPTVSTVVAHGGTQSAKVDGVPSPATHAEQDGAFTAAASLFSFWFYPEAYGTDGHFVAELLRNWNPSAGTAEVPTGVTVFSATVRWAAWRSFAGTGVLQDVAVSLAPGAWHSVQVVMDGGLGIQCLFVDGAEVASASVSPADTFDGTVVLFGDASYFGDAGIAYYDDLSLLPVTPATAGVCPFSQGYWKTHLAAWPVDSLALGTRTYSKSELTTILRTPPRGDASLILAHQLIAAKLNVALGVDPSPIAAVLVDADGLLGGTAIPQHVAPSSPLGQQMVANASMLDDFNNGRLTPGC